jgi:hypothetical protein
MGLSDRGKFALLGVCLTACLSTFWTSMGGGSLGTLQPSIDELCIKAHKAVRSCLDEPGGTNSGCNALLRQGSACESAVVQAYRKINMGGCTLLLQNAGLCQTEWCSSSSSKEECDNECKAVRTALSACERHIVEEHFQSAGLSSDGTFK